MNAVNGVSFVIRKGRTLGIVGESGSGKTSLGRLIIKLLDSDSGRIIFNGQDIANMRESEFRAQRPYIQMVFQDPFASLNPRHTIRHILTVGQVAQAVRPVVAEREAERYLKVVGLDRSAMDRYPHEFSGGQRQRVGIARALMFNPELLIADESVSALDVSIQAQVLELLKEVQEKTKVAMMFITHDLKVASQVCDEVAVMHLGEIVEFGPPGAVFNNPSHAYTKKLVSAIPGRAHSLQVA